MLDTHTSLRRHQSTADPLALVADDIASTTRVLCLDEFFVTDVADAMILHRLFARLWDRGMVLVATSNRHPDALYEGGLQRDLFLPFIRRLKEECVVHDMASPTDYRQLAHHRAGMYFLGPSGDEDLYERFMELANSNPVRPVEVEVAMGRHLLMPRVGEKTISQRNSSTKMCMTTPGKFAQWDHLHLRKFSRCLASLHPIAGGCIAHFTFSELCDRPLGAADYIALANSKHSLAIAGIPKFTAANRTSAYRFVTLIDVLYEHRVRVLCSAEALPVDLFDNIMTHQEAKAEGSSLSPDAVSLLPVATNSFGCCC